MSTVKNTQPETSPLPEEAWLRCPGCDYCLVGLTEHRCPECGVPFDIEHLRALASDRIQPVRPWDDPQSAGFWGPFSRTCWATWFTPTEFARNFPVRVSAQSAVLFSLTCYVAVGAVVLSGALAMTFFDPRYVFLAVLVGLAGAVVTAGVALICEVLLAAILARLVPPTRGRKRDSYAFWRSLTHFTSSYLLLPVAGTTVCLVLWIGICDNGPAPEWVSETFILLVILLPATATLWYCYALGAFILTRGQGSPSRRALAIVLVFLLTAIISVVAVGMGLYLLGEALSRAR